MAKLKRHISATWKELRTSNSFVQNAAYMFSASAWGIALQFLFSPILSRIYDPEAYGLFGIFNSIVVVIGVFVTLGYSQAFVLPKSDEIFRGLLKLAIRSTLIISGIITVVCAIGWQWINPIFNAEDLGSWTILIGPMVFLLALDKILIDWSVREKAFKKQSLIAIPVTLGSKSFNVAYGIYLSSAVDGLIITNAINYLVRIGLYLKKVIPNALGILKETVSPDAVSQARREYSDYPRFVMWSNALNTASNYTPVVLLPVFLGSARPAGLFTFALLVLDLPARLIASTVNKVYFQRAVELKRDDHEKLAKLTWRIFRVLMLIVFIPLIVLATAGEWLYTFVFGAEWTEAGLLAGIMGSYYFFRLASSPVSSIFNVLRREKALFRFQFLLFALRLGSLIGACLMTSDLVMIIVVFSAANALAYLILIGWIFTLLKHYALRSIIYSLALFAAAATIVWLIRGS